MPATTATEDEHSPGPPTLRTIRSETRRRGLFGKAVKLAFVLFNLAMLAWLSSYVLSVAGQFSAASSEAVRTGIAAGTTIGVGFILLFWAAGDVVLGLLTILTRGKVIVVEERRA